MEVKKSPKADIQRYNSLFFLIGLIIALGVCIFAFNWKTQYKLDSEITSDMGRSASSRQHRRRLRRLFPRFVWWIER